MAKFGAIYLSFPDSSVAKIETISEKLKQEGYLFTLRYHYDSPWIQLYIEEPENIAKYTENVSKIFPERRVLGLGAYTVSDSVIFCEFQEGNVVRWLQSGFERERQWEKILGEVQPWESEIFGNLILQIGSLGMASYHLNKIGVFLNLPGFGVPKSGQSWTKIIRGC
jgi:hypothetical protein